MFEGQFPPEVRQAYAELRRSSLEHSARPTRPGRFRRAFGERLVRLGTRVAGSERATPVICSVGGPVTTGSSTRLR